MERYKVLKRIGVGTYGSAYLICWKNNPEVQLVLKKIKLDDAAEKEKHQAETEVKVLAALDHPLVLGYVDHFMYKSHLCIVTEYCEGGDLYQLLKERKTPLLEAQVLDLLVQIVLAVQYVHSKNILHRDLKTQNIFLTKEGGVKLGDFGISRSLSSTVDLASTLIGTPYYMSPEVMSSMPYDFKSDMWSLGCCLYETMSLKHAFDADDMTSLVLKIMRGEHLPIPQTFSPELRDLVKQLLSKNPAMRPSPEQVLKLGFLKDFVTRAKDKVARAQKSMSMLRRKVAPPAYPPPPPQHDSNLDQELALARERLQKIQIEREALWGSPHGCRAVPPAPSAPLCHRHSTYNEASSGNISSSNIGNIGILQRVPSTRYRRSDDGSMVLGAPIAGRRAQSNLASSNEEPIPPGVSKAALDGDGSAPSSMQRANSERVTYAAGTMERRAVQVNGHNAYQPSMGAPPRPLGHRGSSNDISPIHSREIDFMNITDPKARKEAKRKEEIRRREEELLQARKAYFEERKAAENKKWELYHGSVRATTNSLPRGSGGAALMGNGRAPPRGPEGSRKETAEGTGHPHARYRHSYNGDAQASYSLLDSSEDELEVELRARCKPPPAVEPRRSNQAVVCKSMEGKGGALQEFEAELSNAPGNGYNRGGNQALLQTLEPGADSDDKVMALRKYCIANLGMPLFDMIYKYMRKRLAAGSVDDSYFRQELTSRLGPARMQYVHLIDQLLFYEDRQS